MLPIFTNMLSFLFGKSRLKPVFFGAAVRASTSYGLPWSLRSCVSLLEPHISAFPNILNLRTQTFVHRLNSSSLNFAAFSSFSQKSFATILLSCFVVVWSRTRREHWAVWRYFDRKIFWIALCSLEDLVCPNRDVLLPSAQYHFSWDGPLAGIDHESSHAVVSFPAA